MRGARTWGLMGLIAVTAGLGACGGGESAPDGPALLADWSSVDVPFVVDLNGQAVLMGVDVTAGTVGALAVVPRQGDTRTNQTAQVIGTADGQFDLVLPEGAGSALYSIDLAGHALTRRGTLSATAHVARLGDGLVGTAVDSSSHFRLSRYSAQLKPETETIPLDHEPSYAGVSEAGDVTCYGGGDGLEQYVESYRAGATEVTTEKFQMAGNLTGVACSAVRTVVAIGDADATAATAAASAPGDARVSINRPPAAPSVTVLTASSGSSGQVAWEGPVILTDVAASYGRRLVVLDAADGKQKSSLALEQTTSVETLVPMGRTAVALSSANVYVAQLDGGSVKRIPLEGMLYDMNVQLAPA